MLSKNEIDIESSGLGVSVERTSALAYTIPTYSAQMCLFAMVPEGTAPQVWVYTKVFGFTQWVIFLALLVMVMVALTISYSLKANTEFTIVDKILNSMGVIYLFTIQLGDHPDGKQIGSRLLSLTMSMLTLFMFMCYANDITAEMTSGPKKISVRNFEDVIHQDYKIITGSQHYVEILASSDLGTSCLLYTSPSPRDRG